MEQYWERYQRILFQVFNLWNKNFQTKNYVAKHIESDYPRQRYQADTVYLDDYISNDTRYLFTMVDHFTKFLGNFNENKKQKTILSAFKQWLTFYLKSKNLHTDNCGEFKNKVMENYLKESNIYHITGGPYNPQHQGAVEALNKTIKNFLISAKDH